MTVAEAVKEIERLYEEGVERQLAMARQDIEKAIVFLEKGDLSRALELLQDRQKILDSQRDKA